MYSGANLDNINDNFEGFFLSHITFLKDNPIKSKMLRNLHEIQHFAKSTMVFARILERTRL